MNQQSHTRGSHVRNTFHGHHWHRKGHHFFANKKQKEETTPPQQKPSETIYNRIAFIELSGKKKADVADKILTDLFAGRIYVFELLLSVVIAALWLLINSTAVVIGAMLIAPILRPIQGMAFSISTGSNSLYMKSWRLLIGSILASIVMSAFIAFLVPFDAPTAEILARTSPTIIDLMIALAGGTIALLSLWFTRLSESVAWVAMAASLIPPLCVCGIGLAWFEWDIARGSFLLFSANLIAIIIVGVIIFYAFGFYPTNKQGQKTSAMQLVLVLLTTLVVIAPLLTGLQSIVRDIEIKWGIQTAMKVTLPWVDANSRLESFDYTLENKIVSVTATLKTSDTTRITPADKAVLIQAIANKINRPVSLTLELIPTTSIYVPKKKELTIKEKITNDIAGYLSDFDGVFLLDVIIGWSEKQPLVSLQFYSQKPLKYEQVQNDMLQRISPYFAHTPLLVLDLQVKPPVDTTPTETGDTTLQDTLAGELLTIFPMIELNQLEATQWTKVIQTVQETGAVPLTWNTSPALISQAFEVMNIFLDISSALPKQTIVQQLDDWKIDLEKRYNVLVEFDIQLRAFEKFSLE